MRHRPQVRVVQRSEGLYTRRQQLEHTVRRFVRQPVLRVHTIQQLRDMLLYRVPDVRPEFYVIQPRVCLLASAVPPRDYKRRRHFARVAGGKYLVHVGRRGVSHPRVSTIALRPP